MLNSKRIRRGAVLVAAASIALAGLTACSSTQTTYCNTINGSSLSAVTYTSYIGDMSPSEWAEPRIELLGEAGAPTDELQTQYETWLGYLNQLTEYDEPDVAVLDLSTGEVDTARQSLFDNYVEACL
ncbi:MAG: hypothetical protein ACTH31_03630 [Pseudoclavibacter sp.]